MRKITNRLMWPNTSSRIRHVPNRISFENFGANAVIVLSAESGAGKTHALLTTNPNGITVILTPKADFPSAADTPKNKNNFVRHVRVLFEEAIYNSKTKLEACNFVPWTKALPPIARHRLHIVVDEAYSLTNFVRCLCRWRSDIIANLVGADGPLEGLHTTTTLTVLCAGIGISSPLYKDVSSDPKQFTIVEVSQQLRLRDVLAASFNAGDTILSTVIEAALDNPCLQQLEYNARASRLCLDELEILRTDFPHVPSSNHLRTRAAVFRAAHHIFYKVVDRFHSMNALQRAKHAHVVLIAKAAFRLLLCERSPLGYAEQLVGEYGVIADRTTKVVGPAPSDSYARDPSAELKQDPETKEIITCYVPKNGRYEMSCTMAAILSYFLHFNPYQISCVSGAVLERILAQKVFLAVGSATTPTEFYRNLALRMVPTTREKRFSFPEVKLVVLDSWFTGNLIKEKGETTLNEKDKVDLPLGFEKYLDDVANDRFAYVFINPPGASYADVFLVGKGLVAFFQAKDHTAKTDGLSPAELQEEIVKCGLASAAALPEKGARYWTNATQMLLKAANLETASDVVFTVVRTD